MEGVTTLFLVLALWFQSFIVGRLARRVKLLEKATAHLTPDHRLDAVEKTVGELATGTRKAFEGVNKALVAFSHTDQMLLNAIAKVQKDADETYFRKDQAN